MKQIKNIKDKINKATWSAEHCHPHKWDDSDYDRCITFLETRHYGLRMIEELVSEMLDDIIFETANDEDRGFEDVSVRMIADRLAHERLACSTQVFPDSATFTIENY